MKASDNRHGANRYLYPIDLDADGNEELIVAGFENQPNTPKEYTDTLIHVFGWRNGVFQNITASWLPGDMNKVQGVGDIAFGDFNGDGKTDAYLSAYTDMHHEVNSFVLMNNGASFSREILEKAAWQHGVAAGDINNDGFHDVVSTGYHDSDAIYFGSPNGLIKYDWVVGTYAGGSGAELGDFLGDGSTTLILVDNGFKARDGNLYRLSVDSVRKNVRLRHVSTLPTPRLESSKWDAELGNKKRRSHDVRVKGVDFTNDGLLDAIILSHGRYLIKGKFPEISQVQFLENLGEGKFVDVTGEILSGYNYSSNPSYVPVILDFDNDGGTDIFLSEIDWSGEQDSTTILLQNRNGKYHAVDWRVFYDEISGYSSGDFSSIIQNVEGSKFIVVNKLINRRGTSETQLLIAPIFSKWEN